MSASSYSVSPPSLAGVCRPVDFSIKVIVGWLVDLCSSSFVVEPDNCGTSVVRIRSRVIHKISGFV